MKILQPDYSLFSKYRTAIMGLAALFIMLFHSTTVTGGGIYSSAAGQLNIGVELFLIVSGIGLYFALSKPSFDFKHYYIKRLLNVYLIYLIIFLPIIIFNTIKFGGTVADFLLDWTGIAFFTGKRYVFGNHGAWYVMFIMLVYAVYPLIFRVQKLLERKRADLACLIVFCVLYILLCYFLSVRFKDVYDRYEVAATRLPVFLVGSYMGRLVYEKRKFSYGTYLTTALGMIVYFFTLWKPLPFVGARFYKLLLSVGICVIFVVVMSALRLTFLEKLLTFFGGMSLELYLTHNLANEFLFEKGHCDGILQYIIIIGVSTAVSYLVSKLRRKIISAYEKQ